MGMIYDDLYDHEGYAARRLPDGSLTGTWSRDTDTFTGYIAVCSCGWTGDHPHPPTEAGRRAAEDQWDNTHARPLLAVAVPARITELVDNLREEIAELASDRPLAARTVAQRLTAWSEHILQRTATAELQRQLDPIDRQGPDLGLSL